MDVSSFHVEKVASKGRDQENTKYAVLGNLASENEALRVDYRLASFCSIVMFSSKGRGKGRQEKTRQKV